MLGFAAVTQNRRFNVKKVIIALSCIIFAETFTASAISLVKHGHNVLDYFLVAAAVTCFFYTLYELRKR